MISYSRRSFADEVHLVSHKSHSKSPQAQLYTMFFTENLYKMWTYKNSLMFNGAKVDTLEISKQIIFNVACRCSHEVRRLLIV